MIVAVWLLVASLIFDFGDGLAARLLNAYSDLGLQLDSLADMVSFGVAPGIIMYQLILSARGAEQVADYLIYVPVIIPLFSGLRLAKFNIDRAQSEQFRGLATPGNAFFIFSLVLANHYSDSIMIENLVQSRISLVALTVVFGSLLITNIPMFSFKFRNLKFKGNELRILFIASCLLLFIGTGFASLPLIIILYIIVSVTWAIIN
jgi:CDP-diacylglycerol--serine O-phosphatidyltransferase